MAELFDVQRPAITKHLKNILDSGELREDSVSSILEHTAEYSKKYNTKFYNLDAIIAVGYRSNSIRATQFRIWATDILKEYIIKGFAMDNDRIKNGRYFGKDYFRELLEKVSFQMILNGNRFNTLIIYSKQSDKISYSQLVTLHD
ncbi:virulence RhuM family protein [bacterium]|nr:virulence RhuM family protein [bacterium]